ncbi:MAG TPA: diguanylate cyclase [Gemmatimonadales bacterium]|nr:diguanylate cyclase [Gemmatimonadales bacterium]
MFIWLLVGVAVGAVLVASRGTRKGKGSGALAPGANPLLLPDPALRWLAEARGALGVWTREAGDGVGEQPVWQVVTPGGRLSPEAQRIVQERLETLGERAGGTERLDSGVLVHGRASRMTAGILLPLETNPAVIRSAENDLAALLDGLARRPGLQMVFHDGTRSTESLGSVGLRLAYQMERILNAQIIVAVATPAGVRVIGTSSRADRRLMESHAQPGSPIYQVATGEVPHLTSIADPLGGTVHDRRTQSAPAIVYPIRANGADGEVVGAVAFWADDDASPIGPVIAEVQEVLRNAGPRMWAAREIEEKKAETLADSLTGLKNRKGLELAMGRVGITQAVLLCADLDKFKLLNDTLGHAAGDAALVHFARTVHDIIRGGDTAARVGGEEFAIWLPGASLAVGAQVAERIRIRLATTPWDWQGRTWPLSVSIGVASLPETTRSVDNLVAQADSALYEAKRLGRDRVQTARLLSPM